VQPLIVCAAVKLSFAGGGGGGVVAGLAEFHPMSLNKRNVRSLGGETV